MRRVHEISLAVSVLLMLDRLCLFDVLGSIGDSISRAHHADDRLRIGVFLVFGTISLITGLVLVMRKSADMRPPYRSCLTYCAAVGIGTLMVGGFVHDVLHMEDVALWLCWFLPIIAIVGPLCLWTYRRHGITQSRRDKAVSLALESVICLVASLPLSVIAYAAGMETESCYLGPLLLPLGWHFAESGWFILPRTLFLFGIWCGIRALFVSRKPRPWVVVTASILGVALAILVIVTRFIDPRMVP